ncbi:HesA/MoeB/ThiF family protein [Methanococcus voltae]|uniref:UBA/THIF-type NAD/FAD binding protein n=1 Tax=Methanococcus voltae (strain ATCC BAA-1334 / A3) TaxID=456320 RepID=D7DSD7_METV3|nr:HesA/MoeB/ThiF family protein [Methanococcus voltae]MCS3901573.1 molybdopterin/thiamine biosynthesis adenylyltransferase [Methanococcus voltae]
MGLINQNSYERYARQINLEGFGKDSQDKLLNSKVSVIGAGGLGSIVLQYLTSAGIGEINILDYQDIELSNLNRQIIHNETNLGHLKVESAKEKLEKLNSDVKINIFNQKLEKNQPDSDLKFIKKSDLIVDCLDNFEARYILNDLALKYDKPLIHGAIEGLHGQVSTIVPNETPCLRCIFKTKENKDKVPVLGFTAGVVGSIQVGEAIKYITEYGETLKNKLLSINLKNNEFLTFKVKKNPNCICNDKLNQ